MCRALHGVNVGGNNIIRMPALAACLEAAGCRNARTYIASEMTIRTSGTCEKILALMDQSPEE